jgi:hypothetical protein
MTEIVALVARPLVAGQVAHRRRGVGVGGLVAVGGLVVALGRVGFFPSARRLGGGARPEFEHDVLIVSNNGPLGFHCRRSAKNPTAFIARWQHFQHEILLDAGLPSVRATSDGTCCRRSEAGGVRTSGSPGMPSPVRGHLRARAIKGIVKSAQR